MDTVKTLIAALKTERDSLDRAIFHLEQIGKPSADTPAPAPVRRARRAVRTRAALTMESKRSIVGEMAAAAPGTRLTRAKGLARAYGCQPTTISAMWKVWQQKLGANGVDHTESTTDNTFATV